MDCSALFKLCKSDVFKGFVMALIAMPLGIIIDFAQAVVSNPNATLTINWKVLVASAVLGGGSYIVKNFLTGSGGKMLSNDPPKP